MISLPGEGSVDPGEVVGPEVLVSSSVSVGNWRSQSQKLEVIGRLTAGIVHDFNNILCAIDSGLRLLDKELAAAPKSQNVDALMEELHKRTENASSLMQQLLAFSRQHTFSPEPIDLNRRLKSLSRLLTSTVGPGVAVRLKLDPEAGPIIVDANQFDVAILNLAMNARDAMGDHGTLTVETSLLAESPESAGEGSFIRVTVSDTGCGMDEEVLSQVFEPFFTTKAEGEGTGLGLSQVYGFAQQSAGRVRIESGVGKGTAVHLILPQGGQGSS